MTKSQDERRIALVEKKYDSGLTRAEAIELAKLQVYMYEHLRKVAPRDTSSLDEMDARIEGLKARIMARKACR